MQTAKIEKEQESILKTETDHISVDLEVAEFTNNLCNIESIDEVDNKTINYIERMIRGSYEYKQYISYLRNELDINSCSILENIDAKDLDVSLEMHHYPFTLFDIVTIVLNKMLSIKKASIFNNDVNTIYMFDLMEEVMRIHYQGLVGLVPVSTSAHEMAHSGAISIPFDKVYGNTQKFVLRYRKYIPEAIYDKYVVALGIDSESAKEANKNKIDKNILDYNITYNNPRE